MSVASRDFVRSGALDEYQSKNHNMGSSILEHKAMYPSKGDHSLLRKSFLLAGGPE